MSVKQIRLNSVISLEEEQEKDIIELVERLNASHKMGEFITVLLRVASDCPEILEKRKGRYESGEVTRAIHKQGMSSARAELVKEYVNMIVEMRNKVDYIYDETLKLGATIEAGNRLGVSGKLENLVLANFVLRKQIEDLQTKLGFGGYGQFKADVVGDYLKKVDDIMEYIITTYASEFSELKSIVQVKTDTVDKPVESNRGADKTERVEQVVRTSEHKQATSTYIPVRVTANGKVEEVKTEEKGKELIVDDTDDFDDSLLKQFFG